MHMKIRWKSWKKENTKASVDRKRIMWGGVDGIHLAEDKVQWWAVVNTMKQVQRI
jgi:hypothetical protein